MFQWQQPVGLGLPQGSSRCHSRDVRCRWQFYRPVFGPQMGSWQWRWWHGVPGMVQRREDYGCCILLGRYYRCLEEYLVHRCYHWCRASQTHCTIQYNDSYLMMILPLQGLCKFNVIESTICTSCALTCKTSKHLGYTAACMWKKIMLSVKNFPRGFLTCSKSERVCFGWS